MTKINTITRACIIVMAIMMIASTLAITASASVKDTSFSYSLTGGDNYKTAFREKENNSSCYMKCSSATGGYQARVYSGPRNACAVDCSGGYYYYFVQGNARFMYNLVIERGYDIAAIFATTYNNGTIASGVWSPDSVPQAGVLPGSDYLK